MLFFVRCLQSRQVGLYSRCIADFSTFLNDAKLTYHELTVYLLCIETYKYGNSSPCMGLLQIFVANGVQLAIIIIIVIILYIYIYIVR